MGKAHGTWALLHHQPGLDWPSGDRRNSRQKRTWLQYAIRNRKVPIPKKMPFAICHLRNCLAACRVLPACGTHCHPPSGPPTSPGGRGPALAMPFPLMGGCARCVYYSACEGPPKKIDGPPRAFAKSRTRPPTIRLFLPCFLLIRFSGVSRQGEFKNTMQMFLQKVHVESFSQNNISTSVLPQLFLFHHGYGCCSAMGVQKHYQKIRVERFLQKTRPKSQNRFFLRSFV